MHFSSRWLGGAAIALGAILIGCGGSGNGGGGGGTAGATAGGTAGSAGKFAQVNLVADTAGKAAITDPNLVNPWGISFAPGGAFWVSDNGTGLSTLYNTSGAIQGLVVTIPAAGGKTKGPTSGQVYNNTADFSVGGTGPAAFIFVNEDGVISGWNSGTTALLGVDRSATGAVYKGVALGSVSGVNYLYAANFNSGKVDMFTGSFGLFNSFTDPNMPVGFAPFGIANIGGQLYVTYAKQDAAKHDDVKGAGNGYVDIFSTSGTFVKRLISQGALNSPWAVVQAPGGFGTLGGDLLVGNFGDGHINAYNISTGASVGALDDTTGKALAIDGLWGLIFGNGGSGGKAGTLYFTAGPNSEANGLFGSLTAQ
jgi:uncharacterized protein (TIGR03118 family)